MLYFCAYSIALVTKVGRIVWKSTWNSSNPIGNLHFSYGFPRRIRLEIQTFFLWIVPKIVRISNNCIGWNSYGILSWNSDGILSWNSVMEFRWNSFMEFRWNSFMAFQWNFFMEFWKNSIQCSMYIIGISKKIVHFRKKLLGFPTKFNSGMPKKNQKILMWTKFTVNDSVSLWYAFYLVS